MSIAGPFTYFDYDAEPTITEVDGEEVPTWPALAGVFCICDVASFARSAEQLTAHRVTPAREQAVLSGVETVTLHFTDAEAAQAVIDAEAALGPIPATAPSAEPVAPPPRKIESYRFKAALRLFPSVSGDPTRTLRDDADGLVAFHGGVVADRYQAVHFYRNDGQLNGMATMLAGGDAQAAQGLLDAAFAAAEAIP